MGVIQRQGIKSAIVTFSGLLLGVVSLLFIQPRFLTPEEIGLTRVLFNFASLVAVLMPLGIGHITTKFFPIFRDEKNGHNGFLGLLFLFNLTGFALVSALLWLLKPYFISQYQAQSQLFTEYFNCVFPLSFFLSVNWALILYCSSAIFRSTIPSLLNDVLVRLLSIALFSIYFLKWISLTTFVWLFVGIYGTQLLGMLLYIFSLDNPSLKINWSKLKHHNGWSVLRFGLWMSFVALASLGIKYIDSLVLAKYYQLELVGIYTIAAFIPNLIEAPLMALERITVSVVSHNLQKNHLEEVKRIYTLSVKYLLLFCGLMYVGIITNMQFVLQLLPPKYAGGLEVVYIIATGSLVAILAGCSSSIIFNSSQYISGGIMLIGLVITNIILNLLLVPHYGMNGAALANALSALLYTLLRYFIVWRQFRFLPFDKSLLPVLLLIVALIGINQIIPVLQNPLQNILIRAVPTTLIWLAVIFGTGLAKRQDLKF